MARSTLAVAIIALAGLAGPPAVAQKPMHGMARPQMASPKMSDPARSTDQFLRRAAQSDQFEIQEGRLAQRMAHNPRVKAFAVQMVKDHSRSTAEMQAAARRAGIRVGPPPPLSPEQQQQINSTQGMASMGGFDADYVSDQVMAHEAALALMTNYARGGSSAPIRQAAARLVPTIRGHLQMIQAIQRSMPKGRMGHM